ncbi:MAG: PH domain-containing protein [Bacteroidetes bacterium]|jgi:membrane protein YdbS with pleckstrin-like domain|nr:PH domain-containing protein [Bacteroidota bacterium]
MDKQFSKKLSPRTIGAWRWGSAAGNAVFLAVPSVYYSFFGLHEYHLWIVLFLSLLFLTYWVLSFLVIPGLRWKNWRYSINEHEIDLLRGVLVKTETLIPLSRVQHVDTSQGPLLRWYGLSSVTISTAATTHEIPGLDEVIADRVRRQVSTYARLAEEDV